MIKSVHELTFDNIDLTGRTNYGGTGDLKFYALAESATLGNPVPVDRGIATALLDGAFVVTDRHENREPAFQIQIEADDSDLLDQGQAMLFRSCSRSVLLGWKPPDGWGERRLYRAFTSHLEHRFDDLDEMKRSGKCVRTYLLRLICDPWAYSEESVVTVASADAPVTPSTTTISDGTSSTGWSSPPSSAAQPSVSSGKLSIRPDTSAPEDHFTSEATRTLTATDFSATPYITAEFKAASGMHLSPLPDGGSTTGLLLTGQSAEAINNRVSAENNPAAWAAAYVDGVKLSIVAYQTLADGSVRYSWRSTATAGTALRFRAGTTQNSNNIVAATSGGFLLDNVTRSNVNPAVSSSGRQSLRTLNVGGSARTAPMISIEHETSALGGTVFYTCSLLGTAGYGGPALRPFLSGGTPVTDTNAVSGAYVRTTNGYQYYSVPANQLPPGSYLIMLRAKGPNANDLGVKVAQVEGSTVYGETFLSGRCNAASGYSDLTEIGVVTLPRQNAPTQSNAAVRFQIGYVDEGEEDVEDTAMVALGTFDVDEIWAFYLGEGAAMTWVECGTGSPSLGVRHNRVWIDTATALSPKPGLFVGTAAERADAFDPGYPAVKSRGTHPVVPGVNPCIVITTGARNPTITQETTDAWF